MIQTPSSVATNRSNNSIVGSSAPQGARWALLLLLSINLVNYVDRLVLAAVEPRIREDIVLRADPADQNPKLKTGSLFTAFLVSYMAAAPLFGWLAERRSRWLLIAIGVSLWSLASGASGLAATFAVLLLTRCFVGIGGGAPRARAPDVIADYFPVSIRGQVLSWFYMAIPVGGGWATRWGEAWRESIRRRKAGGGPFI